MMGSSFFIGLAIGTAVLSRLGDTVGRIVMLRIGMFCSVALYGYMVFGNRTLETIYVIMFFIGILSCLRVNIAFIYS